MNVQNDSVAVHTAKTDQAAKATATAKSAPNPGLPWLVADVGGTNARFGWVEQSGAGVQQIQKLATADYAGPAAAAQAYLLNLAASVQQGGAGVAARADSSSGSHPSSNVGAASVLRGQAPRRAALAVATAVQGDRVSLTNSAWAFSRQELQAALGLERLIVLNDFEALALSLPRLTAAQLQAIGPAWSGQAPSGTLAVIGPGTGLGVAGVVHTRHGWVALPGEGGHATLAAADDFESEVLKAVRRQHPHVSAERLLSGIGLPVLHAAIAAVQGINVGGEAAALAPEQIVAQGVDGSDALCGHTLDSFCAFLGSFAGNVALTLGARGGVYIGGGIVPRLGERLHRSAFRARFEAKGRFQPYLSAIPTLLITDTLAALTGAALALEQIDA